MTPIQIDAQFAELTEQRNAALNRVVYLTGALAVANAKNAELEKALADLLDQPKGEVNAEL